MHSFLKLDFKNAFNSLKRETMLNHVFFSNRPELYKYTRCLVVKLVTFSFTEALA